MAQNRAGQQHEGREKGGGVTPPEKDLPPNWIPMNPGGYAFGEKPIVRVMGAGEKTSVWIGLNNVNGSCLGELSGKALDALLEQIAEARYGRKTKQPTQVDSAERVARRAEPTKFAKRRR